MIDPTNLHQSSHPVMVEAEGNVTISCSETKGSFAALPGSEKAAKGMYYNAPSLTITKISVSG